MYTLEEEPAVQLPGYSEGYLVLPLQFDNARWMQFEENTLCILVAQYGLQTLRQTSEGMLNSYCLLVGYRVQQGLYTILSCTLIRVANHAFAFPCIMILLTINSRKTSYTVTQLVRAGLHISLIVIYAMQLASQLRSVRNSFSGICDESNPT